MASRTRCCENHENTWTVHAFSGVSGRPCVFPCFLAGANAEDVDCALGCCSVHFAFAVAGSRAARSLLFFPLVFVPCGARARDPSHKTLLFTVFVAFAFPGWLRAGLFGLLFLGPLARARATLGWGPAGAQKAGIPGIIWGNMHNLTSYVIAQDALLIQKKHDMTWYNFEEA